MSTSLDERNVASEPTDASQENLQALENSSANQQPAVDPSIVEPASEQMIDVSAYDQPIVVLASQQHMVEFDTVADAAEPEVAAEVTPELRAVEATPESGDAIASCEPIAAAAVEQVAVEQVEPEPVVAEPVTAVEPVAAASEPAIAEPVVVESVAVEPVAAETVVVETEAAAAAQVATTDAEPPATKKKKLTKSEKRLKRETAQRPSADALLFNDMDLSPEVKLAVQMSGYIAPTPVQAEIIPHVLEGRDVLAQSQTGTGKTAAFALPILSRLDLAGPTPQVLVLAPTRELATQVAASFNTYGNCIPKLRVLAIYGGADYEPQLRALRRGVHVVVGTPGRVIDHIRRGSLKLDNIKCLVLDEADEMLNMGFIEDVEFVLSKAPAKRQIALFSATMPDPIRRIADEYLTDAATVAIQRTSLTAESIEQKCVFVEERNKLDLLARLLEYEDTDGVIVFTKTKDSTVAVAEKLSALGLSAAALNGDLPQARRQRTVDQLKAGKLNILVATDVAARGLDVQRISHVFNYDLPHDSESYVHRIGRTGRAGRTGVAVIFLTHRQRGKLRMIERATGKTIEVVNPPTADAINTKRVDDFKARILAMAQNTKKLAPYKKLIAECMSEADLAPEMIASALAAIAHGSKPLFVQDLPHVSHEKPRRERDRDFNPRERGSRDDASSRPTRRPRAPDQGMRRYRIEVGAEDGVRPGNIVGAIANEAGLSGSDIGAIDIRPRFSLVDLPENVTSQTVEQLTKTWVSGKQLKIRPDTGAPTSYTPDSEGPRGQSSSSYTPRSQDSYTKRADSPRSAGGPRAAGGKPYYGKSGGKPAGKPGKSFRGKPGGGSKPAGFVKKSKKGPR